MEVKQLEGIIIEIQGYCNKIKFLGSEDMEALYTLLSEVDKKLAELDAIPEDISLTLAQLKYDLETLQQTISSEQQKTKEEILNMPRVKTAFEAYTSRIANSNSLSETGQQ